MKKVAITGLSGVIGKILHKSLGQDVEIIDLFHNQKHSNPGIKKHFKMDLLNKTRVSSVLEETTADIILHMAAVTHIDICEEDKKNGNKGIVWKINVDATHEIAKFCAERKIPMIFLSTECVFDGKKDFFDEEGKKNPINWYGETKSEAEDLIMSTGAPATIIRSVVAYHSDASSNTIYGKILNQLESNGKVAAAYDQKFTPTYTHDIVHAIRETISRNLLGILHVAPKKSLTPYDFAVLIAKSSGYSEEAVERTDLISLYGPKRAALRLRNACLTGEKSIDKLRFVPRSPEEVFQL